MEWSVLEWNGTNHARATRSRTCGSAASGSEWTRATRRRTCGSAASGSNGMEWNVPHQGDEEKDMWFGRVWE